MTIPEQKIDIKGLERSIEVGNAYIEVMRKTLVIRRVVEQKVQHVTSLQFKELGEVERAALTKIFVDFKIEDDALQAAATITSKWPILIEAFAGKHSENQDTTVEGRLHTLTTRTFYSDKKQAQLEAAKILIEKHPIIVTDTATYLYSQNEGVWMQASDSLLASLIHELNLGKHASRSTVAEIIAHVKREKYKPSAELEEPKELVAAQNGLLNILTGQISDFTPDAFVTTKIPVKYVPDAKCPVFEKFLSEVNNEQDRPLIPEMFGYCLYKDYPIHKIFILLGSGRNGKSTTLGVLRALLGTQNVSSCTLQSLEGHRFALAQLHRKLANIAADLPAKALTSSGNIKGASGQDLLKAEHKNGQMFDFVNYAKLISSANTLPANDDDSDGWHSRPIIIDYPHNFEANPDTNLLARLTSPEELSGVLNLALKSLRNVIARGAFSRSERAEERRKQYNRLSNPLRAFVQDCLDFDNLEAFETKDGLFQSYGTFCSANRLRKEHNSLEAFSKALLGEVPPSVNKDRQERINGRYVRVWGGIRSKQSNIFSNQNFGNEYKIEVAEKPAFLASANSGAAHHKCSSCNETPISHQDNSGKPLCASCASQRQASGERGIEVWS